MSDGTFTDDQVHLWLQEIADEAWISLHYDSPVLGGVGQCEISGGGYKRDKVAMSQPANRTIWALEDAKFTGLTQTRLTHFGINTQASKGRLIAYARLSSPVTILNGRGWLLRAGELAISFG